MKELLEAYERMRPFIMAPYMGYHASGIDADDLWQEVVMDGLVHYEEYDPSRSKLETWVSNRGRWKIQAIISRNRGGAGCVDVYETDVKSSYTDEQFSIYTYQTLLRLSEELQSSERIVVKYFLEGASFEYIGSILWVTRQRAQALFKSAIRRMRRRHREELANIDLRRSRLGD